MATVRFVPGYFIQGDIVQPNPTPAFPPRMGLRGGKSWSDVNALIRDSESNSPLVKLVVLLRHGEGLHNADKARAGDIVWNEELQFSPDYIDSPLTALGVAQSKEAATVLEEQLSSGGLHIQRVIVSPLDRTLQTYEHAFANLREFPATSMEITRETLGVCPCDQRKSMRSKIAAYPHIDFASITDEEDVLWSKDRRETDEEIEARALRFLHEIYYNNPETHVVVVSHSGFSRACFRALGHRHYRPQNAEFIPLLLTSADVATGAGAAPVAASPL